MRININDVAKEAGVHRSTVSRALTGSGPVSAENRDRVLAAVKKLNYHPNSQAASLKSRRRNTWGLLSFWYFTPNSMDHYYSKILGGLLDSANKISYRVLLQNVVGRFDQNPDCIRFCHESQLGGVVIIAPRTEESALKELKRLNLPAILVAFRPRDPELNFIDLDNVKGARMMVEHLAHRGHKRIAFIGGELELSANARDRYEGYMEGMKKAGLALDKRMILNKSFEPAFGAEALKTLLELPSEARPTAAFCATDMLALAMMEEARRRGLAIPEDLAVAGIDNNPEAAAYSPSLTTIHFPFYEMGVQAGEVLHKLSENPNGGPYRILLEPKLVERESTGK